MRLSWEFVAALGGNVEKYYVWYKMETEIIRDYADFEKITFLKNFLNQESSIKAPSAHFLR